MSRIRNRAIKVGIIGAGNVLWAYLQALDRLTPKGIAVLGPVCARNREKWVSLCSRRPGICLVENAEAVVRSDVDAVIIITPPESHAALVRLALESGKHVVVEKPLAPTRAVAESLAELADKTGLHLLSAPFVQLAPTFRALWSRISRGEIGQVHSARALYGNAGSTWATWYHDGSVSPLAEVGIYNLKSLTALVGPVAEVSAMEATAVLARSGADVSHLFLRHVSGTLSSIVSSHAIQRYRRPAIELYGTEGTANLLGDDWDPRGFEIWRNETGCWEEYEPIEPTWLWTDGITEMVMALREGRSPRSDLMHDLHFLEVIEAAQRSTREGRIVSVNSRFSSLNLATPETGMRAERHRLHDHTRPADQQ